MRSFEGSTQIFAEVVAGQGMLVARSDGEAADLLFYGPLGVFADSFSLGPGALAGVRAFVEGKEVDSAGCMLARPGELLVLSTSRSDAVLWSRTKGRGVAHEGGPAVLSVLLFASAPAVISLHAGAVAELLEVLTPLKRRP